MYTRLDVFLWEATRSPNALRHSYGITYILTPVETYMVI